MPAGSFRGILDHMLATVPRTPISATVAAGPLRIDLTGPPAPFAARLEARVDAPGIWLVELTLSADAPAAPPALALRWALPCVDIHALWRGDSNANRGNFPPDFSWTSRFTARACSQAPVVWKWNPCGPGGKPVTSARISTPELVCVNVAVP